MINEKRTQDISDDDFSVLDDVLCHTDGDTDASEESVDVTDTQASAFYNLLKYSLLMFTLPFIVMYYSYFYLKDQHGWTPSSALTSAALAAVIVVYFVIALFVLVAYKEERGMEQRVTKKRN
ncbi:unnamed protein product [Thelazia callipaeda]|uniref:Vacuolar ATPase assembly integral membrane protein VMA21 n=1 Tax=Thelazia callipaeda TaxID=103827 RepID=A0A0N5D320_THECL|nr:unnamed protein product [Thelazia callipaeda]